MPGADSHKYSRGAGTRAPYDLGYDTDAATSDSSSSSYSPSVSHRVSLPPRPSSNTGNLQKRRHICPTCERPFTTSGHLARHVRIHTGERNYPCPFPECETRCSRQDNLQQHYRIHLSPASRGPGNRRTPRRRARTTAPPPSSDSSTSSHSTSHSSCVLPSAESTLKEPRLVISSPPPLASATHYPNASSSLADALPALSSTAAPSIYSSAEGYNWRQYSPSGRDSVSPEPTFTMPSMNDSQYETSYHQNSSTYSTKSVSRLGFTYPGSTTCYRQPYSTPTPTQQVQRPTTHCAPQPLTRAQFSSGSLHEVHTQQATPQMPSVSPRHSISHISHTLPMPHFQPQLHSYATHSGASTISPPSPASSHSLSTQDPSPQTPLYGSWTEAIQEPYVASQTFDTTATSYFTSSSADISPTVIQSPSSYVMNLSSNPSALSTNVPLTTDTTTSRYSSPRPVLAPLHSVHAQVQSDHRSSMPMLDRHYRARSAMAVQPHQVYDVSQSYAYERQSYGIKQQDDRAYGRQEAYGYRDMAMWKGEGVSAIVG